MTRELESPAPVAIDASDDSSPVSVTGSRVECMNFVGDFKNLLDELPLNLWRSWAEVASRYRRSILGPFWLTASTATLIIGYSILAGFLFGRELRELIPFIASGVIAWQFIAGSINEGTKIFSANAMEITSSKTNLLNLVLRHTIKYLINMMHALPILVVVIFFLIGPSWSNLLVIPALCIFLLCSFSFSLIIASFASRFRDLEQLATMGTQFMFYMSPIIWDPQPILESNGAQFVLLNPFYYLITIFRGPLIGEPFQASVWITAGLICSALMVIAGVVHFNLRNRIAFWI